MNAIHNAVSFSSSKEGSGVVLFSLCLVEPDWTMQYQILRAWPFPI